MVPVAINPLRICSCSYPAKQPPLHFNKVSSTGSIQMESASTNTPPYFSNISQRIMSAFPLISSIESILSFKDITIPLFSNSSSFQNIYSNPNATCFSFHVFINLVGAGFEPIHNWCIIFGILDINNIKLLVLILFICDIV